MTDIQTFYVTANLLIGSMPTHLTGVLTWVDNVPQAVRALRADATAVLPSGAFDLAREVLLELGADPAYADFCIAVSQGLWPADCTGLTEV